MKNEKYIKDLEDRVHLLESEIEKLDKQVEFGTFNFASLKSIEVKVEVMLDNTNWFEKNNENRSAEYKLGKKDAYQEIYNFIQQLKKVSVERKKN